MTFVPRDVRMHAEVGDTAGILAALVRIRVFDCLDRLMDVGSTCLPMISPYA